MLGNVWEWLRDARGARAVVAGGSFTTRREVVAAAMTQGTDPKDTHGHIGFRVLRPLAPID
jgi:formylglycine-generating enzyme required for sulfatase activity